MFAQLLLLSGLADAAGTTFSVTYEAAADCPTQAAFEAAIVARSPRARKIDAAADVRFEVTLHAAPGRRQLRVVLADGTVSEREIADDSCTESMQSMAIMAAMILDAQQRQASKTSPDATPAAPVPGPASAPVPTRAPVVPREAEQRSVKANPRRSWLGIAVGAVAEGAAAPTPAFGATLGVELGLERSGVVSPSLRLSGVFAQAKVVETDVGDARFRVVLTRMLLCGLRLGDAERSLRVCSLVDGGALLASGLNARNQRSQAMPWLSFGLGVVGAMSVTGPVSLEVGGGARGMVVHDPFIFSPGQPVHEVPVFTWNFWLGLNYRAW